jgi:tetratricopeptide (TPR) repeat protein
MVNGLVPITPCTAPFPAQRRRWKRPVVRGGLALACLLSILPRPAAAAPAFQTSLDRDTISLGDTATLSMTFTESAPSAPPRVPPIAGLRFGMMGSSQQTTIVNSEVTFSSVYTLDLTPTQTGDFTIPALTAEVNGVRLTSQPLKLRVVRGNPPQAAGAPDAAFVRLVPSATNVYVGQAIPVDVQCYFSDNVDRRSIKLPELNNGNFIVGNMPNNPAQSRIRRCNLLYGWLTFRVPVTATHTGALTLGPATWTLAVFSGQQTFFGWTGGERQLTVTSDAPEINVLPIPTNGAPPTFNGAIGTFTLAQYEAGPLSLAVGDPITLKVRIAGDGSFDSVTLPANELAWREFKTYPPTGKLDSSDPLQIHGSKYFEQVITPLNDEIKEIPPFAFSFFDPSAGLFRTLTHPAIPLSVHATAATPQPTVIASGATPDAQAQNQEIVHIKPLPGRVRPPAPPLIRQPIFLTLQALAPMAWICALLWRWQKDKLANNPRLRRRRQVERLVREGLAQLPARAAANEFEQFYTTVLLLLREQLGQRLDLPAPAITEAVLEEVKGLDDASRALLRDLFRACDQYHYTPEHTSQELASLIPKVKTALAALRRIREPGPAAGRKLAQTVALLLFLAAAGASTARAETVSDTFARANKLYEEGKFSQAAALYDALLRAGQVSPAIYFNSGNAWFKAGLVGRALFALRRAEALAPRDPDIRANLAIIRAQAGLGNPALPGSRWTRWIGRATLNEWTCAASAGVALLFVVLMMRQISPAFAKSSATLTAALALASIWLLACLGLSMDQRLLEKSSIVIVPEAVARRGPMDISQSAFTAHDGAELLVLRRNGDWLEVTDAARHEGWMREKDVALMP